MNKYYDSHNDILYKKKDIRRANPRIIYWILFPQGVRKKNKYSTSYSNIMVAKTFKKAWRLFEKYNGSNIQRLIDCDLGRWIIKDICRPVDLKLNDDELFDKYAKFPEIDLSPNRKKG